jgi:hypothetical protein
MEAESVLRRRDQQMTDFYDDMAATATELLAEFGKPL